MLKKLYFYLSDERTCVFDIKRTVRVDDEKQVITVRYKN